MPDILRHIETDVLVLDGAMGTMLQRANIPPEQCPEQLNVTAPEIVAGIHRDYVLAGADVVLTNTFGGTRVKLDEYGLGDQVVELNRAAVRVARSSGATHVLGDVGPSGLVLEPLGTARFDELFDVFAEQVAALASEEPDAILIETMTDIAEARCALLAARSVTDLPVFVTVTCNQSGRMELSGTDPETAAVILEACGASVVGLNCGLGPEQMLPLVEQMAAATALPLLVQPNAGLPRIEDGLTVFPGTPDEMGAHAARFVEAGALLVGSCCGSTPAFTGAIGDFARSAVPRRDRVRPSGVAVAGPRATVRIGAGRPIAIVGERINPTGKKRLADSLREGSLTVVREYAVQQEDAGATLLDVNVDAAGVDRARVLAEAALALGALVDAPLVFDETDPEVLEPALRRYPGRALVNSVSGGAASMEVLLPIAARYGAAIVVLALDDDGIPATVEGRLEVVERVRHAARALGISDDALVVDCLTLAAATDGTAPTVTLDAVRSVVGKGLATILGVSNVSHGLPCRAELNAAFLAMAKDAGLAAAIVNPAEEAAPDVAEARDVLLGRDPGAKRWIERCADLTEKSQAGQGGASEAAARVESDAPLSAQLAAAIERGDAESAPSLVDALVAGGVDPQAVVADVLTPAIQRLGDAYGRGEAFLPQLMAAADAMKAAVEAAKAHFPEGVTTTAGRVAFATVKGDIHSIGKDICVSMLESQGFAVNDLGVDVAPDRVVDAAHTADVVCLSALMTTTLRAMETIVARVAEETGTPVLVGGAVVTADWAAGIGAGYSDDAPGCVAAVRALVAGGGEGEEGVAR